MELIANDVIEKINNIYKEKGFVSEDTVFDMIMNNGLPLDETDRVCDMLLSMGVLIQNEHLVENVEDIDDVDDRAQLDYEEIFNQVIEKEPSLEEFINKVRLILPPKTREAINLMQQAKSGNEYARNRLIEMMMKVAIKMALNFSNKYETAIDETIQYALEGLVIAYEKFEIGKQDNFSTYAPWWIRQNLNRNINLCNTFYVPVHVEEKLMLVFDIINEHYCDKCMNFYICPNLIKEIANKVECDYDKAEEYYQMILEPLSTELLVENEDVMLQYNNQDEIDENNDRHMLFETVNNILKTLSPKEEKVIRLRYGFTDGNEQTLEQVGQEFNVTRERIRQIEAKAIRKLRHPSRSKILKYFYDSTISCDNLIDSDDEKKKSSNNRSC